jgi:hypothetical protein
MGLPVTFGGSFNVFPKEEVSLILGASTGGDGEVTGDTVADTLSENIK